MSKDKRETGIYASAAAGRPSASVFWSLTRIGKMISVRPVRFDRARHLLKSAIGLIFSRRFDVLYAALTRRLASLREVYLPIEYVAADWVDQATNADELTSISDCIADQKAITDMPLVSVIIPCFNYGQFLEKAIDSVLDQTLAEIEIIVVEGGSTDGQTPEIVRKLAKPKTRIIIHDQPTLVGANRNAGIAAARGRFVCCLDPDDTLDPTYLEKAVYLLETHFYDIVSTGIRFAGERTGTIDVLMNPDLKDMMSGNHITTCAVFRRYLWEKVGGYFDTGKGQDHVAEDWDFWLRCVATGARVRNITGEYLFNYTVHDAGSLSSTNVRSVGFQRKSILERNKALLTSEALARSKSQARRRIVRMPVGDLRRSQVNRTARSLLIVIPFMIVGGAERLLSSVIRYLVDEGWKVTVVSTLPQKGLEDSSSWFKEITNEVYTLPHFLKEWEYASFLHYLMQSRRFDVALLAGSRVFYELLPELTAKYTDVAFVDLLFNTAGHAHSHIEYQPYLTYAIAENPEVISWFRKQGWSDERISLVESGVDVMAFYTERSPKLVKELEIKAEEIVIGFSGRLSKEKAPEVFLKLAAAFSGEPSIRFLMTGSGPLKDDIETEIRKLPKGSRLQFLGLVESTKDYFATYDIFILPSRLDGRPIAVMEALSSGCAVIASRVGGIPALIEGSGAGILCGPANTFDFVEAIRSLISDRAKLAAMKTAAREAATRTLSVKQMGSDYIAAFEAAIEMKRAVRNDDAGRGDTEAQVGARI